MELINANSDVPFSNDHQGLFFAHRLVHRGGAGSPMSNPYLLSNLSEIQPRRGRQLTRESDHCGDSCSERAPEKKQHVCMCMGSAANSSLWAESLLVTARPKEPQYRKMCAEGILKPW